MIALVISLLIHVNVLLLMQVWPMLMKASWLPAWVKPVMAAVMPARPVARPVELQPQQPEEIPLQFVEVDPALASEQAPSKSKYFSTASTLAANPNPTRATDVPRIDGQREDSLKTFDTPRIQPRVEPARPPPPPKTLEMAKLNPAPPQAVRPKPRPDPAAARPAAAEAPGETETAAKDPAETPAAASEAAPELRRQALKSVRQAMAAKGMLVGERMKQEGGVARSAVESSLDVQATPFGDYNYRMVQAVQSRWYELLDDQRYSFERSGRVTATFVLHADGSVSQLKVKQSDVGDTLALLCTLAIDQAQSFGPWPSELKRLMGRDSLEVTFTFSYIFN